MKIMKSFPKSNSAIFMAAFVAVISVGAMGKYAVASIPAVDGKINGCYKTIGGDLRVIDTAVETCTARETVISWDQNSGTISGGKTSITLIADTQGVIDSSRTQNIVSVILPQDQVNYPNKLCVDTVYSPTFISDGTGAIRYEGGDSVINLACGTQYDMLLDFNAPEYRLLAH